MLCDVVAVQVRADRLDVCPVNYLEDRFDASGHRSDGLRLRWPLINTESPCELPTSSSRKLAFIAIIASIAITEVSMGTLTIRNLDDHLKRRLRLRAAARNRSMEEEARQILRAALQEPAPAMEDLGTRIRARFAGLGDVQLALEPREPTREPPDLGSGPKGPARRGEPARRSR